MLFAADIPAGRVVNYTATGVDQNFAPAAVTCSHPSGSIFPIGSTPVTCTAVDSAGNTSEPKSFYITVVDTPPLLTLPEPIFTDATDASGAIVNYIVSASDAVSGDVTSSINCTPPSGSKFALGETTVTCTATDGANNKASGNFKVYVLGSGQEATTPGDSVPVQSSDGGLSMTFYHVDQPGVTTIAPIDPSTIGDTPSGFAVSDVAYEIHTTSAGAANNGVQLAFVVPNSAGMSQAEFEALRVLHNNNGTLEDITSGYDYDNRTIFAYTYSFSPFYLARKVNTQIETLFERATPYKAGSTVPVRLRVRNGQTNANLSSSTLKLTARSLKRLGSGTAAIIVRDSGSANPDSNFRYLGEKDGGSYIFNLSTKGLQAGSYALSFYVGEDRSFFYTVKFEVK